MIYIASDHAGFEYKEELKKYLKRFEEIKDFGNYKKENLDDFVDFAKELSKGVIKDKNKVKGILICGSGHGMSIVSNKYKGIYSAVCWNEKAVTYAVNHNNINVLCIPSRLVSVGMAKKVIKIFLSEKFLSKKKYIRRNNKIKNLERKNFR